MNVQTIATTEQQPKLELQKNTDVSPFSTDYYNPMSKVPDSASIRSALNNLGKELSGYQVLTEIVNQAGYFTSDVSDEHKHSILSSAAKDYETYIADGEKSGLKKHVLCMNLVDKIDELEEVNEKNSQLLQIVEQTKLSIKDSSISENMQKALFDAWRMTMLAVVVENNL